MKINELYLENHQENSNFKVGKKAPPPPCFTNYNLTTFSMSEFGRKNLRISVEQYIYLMFLSREIDIKLCQNYSKTHV